MKNSERKAERAPMTPRQEFLAMIRFMRPAYSKTLDRFCAQFIEPLFGMPDLDGNYILTIGENPRHMFAAHSDTVHAIGGFQKIEYDGDLIRLAPESKSNCLGADCTSGVWLILQMVRANVPGVYAIFAGEEIGCQGSRAYAKANRDKMHGIQSVISFDRKAYESIITFQSSGRTCSDEFAKDLAAIIGLDMKPDPTGSYTDSNEFADFVPECTNVSVGYFSQHTAKESQDWPFLESLAGRLISADWDSLKAYRDPSEIEFRSYGKSNNWRDLWADYYDKPAMTLAEICRDYPEHLADWLEQNGVDPESLIDELGLGGGRLSRDMWR